MVVAAVRSPSKTARPPAATPERRGATPADEAEPQRELVHEADPELERLLAEEEEIERRIREHHETPHFRGDDD